MEYDNTLRDLLGIASQPALGLPPDSLGNVFFNDAAALATLTPQHIEKQFIVADQVVSEALSRNRSRLVTCDPVRLGREACTRAVLTDLVGRAYRRPAEPAEIDALITVSRSGADFDEGLALALRAVIGSPSFLYRAPGSADGSPYRLNEFELASRLSYFLWSTMPDEQLLARARAGELANEKTFRQQIKRMLADPKARAIVDQFAIQWLNLERLDQFTPDPALYPGFDAQLRSDMQAETKMLFQDVIDNDLGALTWLTADYTFANERLARHYGLTGVTGANLRKVPLAGVPRKGIVTQGAILAATSHPNGTSIPRRGSWVKTTLLCQPPPPPPKDIPEIKPPAGFQGTRRQLTEMHRANPACAACHALIDPIGFGLENYDVVGRYRTQDNGLPIDNEGALPDGRRFRGAMELIALLESDPAYARCAAGNLLTYALGRALTDDDKCNVDKLAALAAKGSFSELIAAIALSVPFQMQPGDGGRP